MDRNQRIGWCFSTLVGLWLTAVASAAEPQPVTRQRLETCLELGRQFLLENQLPEGLFRYSYDFTTGEPAHSQSQVRQAGTLWGVALIHQDHPSRETRECVLRGIAFYARHSKVDDAGRRWIIFPGANSGANGTVALVTLALIDFLRSEADGSYPDLHNQLKQYLDFLQSQRRRDGRFYKQYLHRSGEAIGLPSPYFDGEILLALTKAARYMGYDHLRPVVLESAEATYRAYVEQALRTRSDSPETKGFFQWGSMSYTELFDSNWEGTTTYARRAIELSHWMIDVHRTLERRRNTGYAYEGIISAHHLAQATGDAASQQKLRAVCEQGLGKLITWQIGSPIQNEFLQKHLPAVPYAAGGVLNAADDPLLRIDVTQHQMHAVILARRYIWK